MCINKGEKFYHDLTMIDAHYKNYMFAEAGTSTYFVLKTIDPLVFSCYFAVFEYSDSLDLYRQTLKDFNKLLYNTVHNMGNVYDLTEEGIKRMIDYETEY